MAHFNPNLEIKNEIIDPVKLLIPPRGGKRPGDADNKHFVMNDPLLLNNPEMLQLFEANLNNLEEDVARLAEKFDRRAETHRIEFARREEAQKLRLEREGEQFRLRLEREREAFRLQLERQTEAFKLQLERQTEAFRLQLAKQMEPLNMLFTSISGPGNASLMPTAAPPPLPVYNGLQGAPVVASPLTVSIPLDIPAVPLLPTSSPGPSTSGSIARETSTPGPIRNSAGSSTVGATTRCRKSRAAISALATPFTPPAPGKAGRPKKGEAREPPSKNDRVMHGRQKIGQWYEIDGLVRYACKSCMLAWEEKEDLVGHYEYQHKGQYRQ